MAPKFYYPVKIITKRTKCFAEERACRHSWWFCTTLAFVHLVQLLMVLWFNLNNQYIVICLVQNIYIIHELTNSPRNKSVWSK